MRTAAPAGEYATIFNWSPPRSRKVSILSFLAASTVLHLFCFYIFQIIYPPTIALLPPPARVNLITPDSEEGRVLLRWIEAEDPALASTTQRWAEATNFSLPKTERIPSYLTHQPALRQLAPRKVDLSVPSAQPPAPVPIVRPPISASAGVIPTEIKFSAETIGAPAFPPRVFTSANKETPDAAEFRIAINSAGEVRHCFLQESSGDPSLDQQARRYLLLLRFPAIENRESKIENPLTWSIATFAWGNDLAAASAVAAP